jgi:thymidylate synthase
MHTDYCKDGMSDFVCTYANTFLIRDGKLISHYLMRSNCAVHGFGNDVAWAKHAHKMLAADLGVEVGDLIWTATSLHVYQHHFKFLEKMYRDSIGDTSYDINNDKSWEGQYFSSWASDKTPESRRARIMEIGKKQKNLHVELPLQD